MGISLTTISSVVSIATGAIVLVKETVELIDTIKRKVKEWSKQKEENKESEEFKNEIHQWKQENYNLNRNYRQYNKRAYYRKNYYNDGFDYDYDYDLK